MDVRSAGALFLIVRINQDVEPMKVGVNLAHYRSYYFRYTIPDIFKSLSKNVESVHVECPSLHSSDASRNTAR